MTQPTPPPIGPQSLKDVEAWIDSAEGLSAKTAREVKQWVTAYRGHLNGDRARHIGNLAAHDNEVASELAVALKDRMGELAALRADVERGRKPAADLREALQSARAALEAARGVADGLTLNFTDRAKLAEQDVADLQQEQLKRLPITRQTLPQFLGEFRGRTAAVTTAGRRTNVDAGVGVHDRANTLYAEVADGLRALEAAEQREQALAGTPQSLVDRFPALRERVQ